MYWWGVVSVLLLCLPGVTLVVVLPGLWLVDILSLAMPDWLPIFLFLSAGPRHYKYTRKKPTFITSETAVEAAPLKMPGTDAGETSGTHNLRLRPASPEDTMYINAGRESLNQEYNKYLNCTDINRIKKKKLKAQYTHLRWYSRKYTAHNPKS
jgi:hypothetical protein